MKRILEILTLSLFVTLALNVWADDYVDDVYYSPQPRGKQADQPASSKGEVRNEETKVSQSVSEAKEDGKITIEYLPQTADTVVVIRVKK